MAQCNFGEGGGAKRTTPIGGIGFCEYPRKRRKTAVTARQVWDEMWDGARPSGQNTAISMHCRQSMADAVSVELGRTAIEQARKMALALAWCWLADRALLRAMPTR